MNNLRTICQFIESQISSGMPGLRKERQSVTPQEKFDRVRNLEREIARVDQEIDRQVYELYGLTEEEIRIVERK